MAARSAPHEVRTPARVDICGVGVDVLTMAQTVELAERIIADGGPAQHVSINAAKVVEAHNDRHMTEIIEHAGIANADGVSILWAGRLLGTRLPERVTGIDFMLTMWTRAAQAGYSVYLFGAKPAIVAAAAAVARDRGVNVVGARSGFYDDESAVVAEIAAAAPDLLFVALPTPQKEVFIADHLHELQAKLAVGVGGSFDVVAGQVSRAPEWMQRAGLEWAHRLIKEPQRIFRRYFLQNLGFFWLLLRARLHRV
jgi:N-acetylglucosaminyldiphosphoundecaprenol N-acetyl-beta-D-mannosaminyltransferase